MTIGVPKEVKADENRVGLVPVGVETLVERGHRVVVQKGAGIESGALDEEYEAAGAQIALESKEVYSRSELIVKVKEPLPAEYARIREEQILFTYFHFAANEGLTRAILNAKAIAIAYETVQKPNGELPLLVPMNEVAELIALVKRIDPSRLCTASQGGDIGEEEAIAYIDVGKVDFICPHRPRDRNSPQYTAATTREHFEQMKRTSRVVPVHYQEPFRRGYGRYSPSADDFMTDLEAAHSSGAAGWCFHNGSVRGQPDNEDGRPRRS